MESNISEIDITQSRRRYYREGDSVKICPECGNGLKKEGCSVLISAQTESDQGELMTSVPGGHFCEKCPVVVFDLEKVGYAAEVGLRGGSNLRVKVEGIIDRGSIPQDKRHLAIGSDDNPVPLVEFLPELNSGPRSVIKESSSNSFSDNQNAPSIRWGKKIRRNDPCPCGSGTKFKKCCGK